MPLILAAALAAFISPARGAEALGPSSAAPHEVELKTDDGWTLAARWRPAREGRATVILAHGYASAAVEWDRLAARLAKDGVGTLCVDLRGHAGSRMGPRGPKSFDQFDRFNGEWETAVHDMRAAAAFLEARHVRPGRIAFGGASLGAALAARAAAEREQTPFLLLLSGGPGMLPAKPKAKTLAVASRKDEAAWRALRAVEKAGWVEALESPTGHGVQVFDNVAIFTRVVDWILQNAAPTKPRTPSSRRS